MKVNDVNSVPVDLSIWMRERREAVEEALDRLLPPADTRPAAVHEAMRYACMNGGKRLRGILTLAACELFTPRTPTAAVAAAAIEAFHASTLVHDDLPCMDDDDLRRGKPATHIEYGEANALLAGNALLTLALGALAELPVAPPHPPGILAAELAMAGGSQGVIGGQVEDLAAEQQVPDAEQLRYIHTEKTARLIACACRLGALCGGACASKVDALGRYGLELGLAFQVQDDILDCTQSTDVLGKPAHSDEGRGKLTAVAVWGLGESRKQAQEHSRRAIDQLVWLDADTAPLVMLTEWLLNRVS